MSFTQTLEALGSWELELAEQTPDEVLAQVGYYGHLVVVDGQVDVEATGNGLLAAARYVGVCRAKAKPGAFTRSGSGLLYWLGDEDDKGHVIETEISLTNATLAQVVAALMPPTVTVGTVYAQADPTTRYTGKHVFQSRRKALAIALAPFGAELRVNGNFTVDVGTPAQLYDTALPLTSKPSPMIVRKGAGSDLDLVAVGGKVETEGAVWDYSPRVVLLGQTVGTGDDPATVFVTGSADAPSVPWKDPQGNAVKSTRLISESGETSGSVAARAQLQLNRFNRESTAVKVTADDYEISGGFGVGDATYVYDPDSGILDTANQVLFRAEPIHPAIVRVSSLTAPIVEGMTVAWRTDAGVWLDLSPWVVWESAGSREITVGDLPKSLTRPSDPIQDRVDAARGNPSTKVPKAPTGLTLSTSSAINPKGTDSAVITASWNPVTQYVDNTTVALHHYEVQYRPTFRAPQWLGNALTDGTTVDLAVVAALGYDVQVRAVSTGGVASAWTSTASITSAADSTGPGTPSDPVVTQYLGLLRIYWNGLTSVGGAMPADFNRVDVHVGTTSGFTASAATLVSSLSVAGYAHATAPYGSTRFVRFLAYDHNGNPSSASATISGATVQANDSDVAALSVGKLTAGTMAADVVMAGRFTTALTGQRREMNAIGWLAFDASNVLTVNIDGINNLLTGIFKTALTGRRIEIGAAGALGEINFYAPDGTRAFVRSFTEGTGLEAIQFGLSVSSPAGGLWNRINYNSDEYANYRARIHEFVFDRTLANASFRVFSTTNRSGVGAVTVQHLGIDSDNFRYWQLTNGFLRHWINATDTYLFGGDGNLRFHVGPGETKFYPAGIPLANGYISAVPGGWNASWVTAAGFQLNTAQPGGSGGTGGWWGALFTYVINTDGTNGGFECRTGDNTAFVPIKASAFTVSSDGGTKTDIADADMDALALLAATPVRQFRRAGQVQRPRRTRTEKDHAGADVLVDDGPDMTVVLPPPPLEIGLVAQEAPSQIRVTGPDGMRGIDLAQYAALLHKALQQATERIERLEGIPA